MIRECSLLKPTAVLYENSSSYLRPRVPKPEEFHKGPDGELVSTIGESRTVLFFQIMPAGTVVFHADGWTFPFGDKALAERFYDDARHCSVDRGGSEPTGERPADAPG